MSVSSGRGGGGAGARGLDGHVAVVTGAASGMGRAIAVAFAAAGASVAAADVDADGGEEAVESITGAGGAAFFQRTDVSAAAEVAALVDAAVARFGPLTAAVNAAGIEGEGLGVAETDDERFDRIVAVNLRGTYLCLKHEVRAILAGGRGGAIVNIASTSSFRPQPRQPAYAAAKHGVLGLTRSAALDYAASGIRVNAICPGAVDTPMLRAAIERSGSTEEAVVGRLSPLGRLGHPSEVAAAAVWLCSGASFTTGHALTTDAGYLLA